MKKILFSLLALVVCTTCVLAQGCVAPTSTSTITLKRLPAGLLEGDFSVSATKKVQFVGGNLQYNSNTQKWQIAEHQYDYIGNAAGNTSVTTDGIANNSGIVDLFRWVGASSSWTGLKQYGISSSWNTNNVNGYGTSTTENLKDDWGNTLGAGLRTLTKEEWIYLFNTRTGSTVDGSTNIRFAKATVNGINGVILFPDDGTFAASEFTAIGSPNSASVNYTTTCTTAEWNALEDKGCVFLPAAGSSNGTYFTDNYYWASSPDNTNIHNATGVFFDNTRLEFYAKGRYFGCSVRLVLDVE